MKFFFYLLVLFLPTQLGRHFWPNFSFIQGIRIDYLSPTIYLTDILILLLLITWISSRLKLLTFNFQLLTFLRRYWLLIILIVLSLAGIYFARSPLAGLYGIVRLLEFSLLGFYIAKVVNTKKEINKIIYLLTAGIIFESFSAILQFLNQGSLGGIFWFFGERTFNGQTPGIANAVINGALVLRPYATFPHPNVLAGYLTIVMAMVISSANWRTNFKKALMITSLSLGTLALILTMGRVAIGLWGILLLAWLLREKKLAILLFLMVIGVILYFSPIPSRFTSLSLNNESFVRREELNIAAIKMIKKYPIFGVGLNNFLVNLPNFQQTKSTILYLQPVHNIFLLIFAETGIIGFFIFTWFITKTIKKALIHNSQFLIPLGMVLVLGLFDHYFLTLQQGQLLFSLVLGLCWSKIK